MQPVRSFSNSAANRLTYPIQPWFLVALAAIPSVPILGMAMFGFIPFLAGCISAALPVISAIGIATLIGDIANQQESK